MTKQSTNKKRNTWLGYIGIVIFLIGTMINSGVGASAISYFMLIVGLVAIVVGFSTKRNVKE